MQGDNEYRRTVPFEYDTEEDIESDELTVHGFDAEVSHTLKALDSSRRV